MSFLTGAGTCVEERPSRGNVNALGHRWHRRDDICSGCSALTCQQPSASGPAARPSGPRAPFETAAGTSANGTANSGMWPCSHCISLLSVRLDVLFRALLLRFSSFTGSSAEGRAPYQLVELAPLEKSALFCSPSCKHLPFVLGLWLLLWCIFPGRNIPTSGGELAVYFPVALGVRVRKAGAFPEAVRDEHGKPQWAGSSGAALSATCARAESRSQHREPQSTRRGGSRASGAWLGARRGAGFAWQGWPTCSLDHRRRSVRGRGAAGLRLARGVLGGSSRGSICPVHPEDGTVKAAPPQAAVGTAPALPEQ